MRFQFKDIRRKLLLVFLSTAVSIILVELFVFYVLDIKRPGYRPERLFQYSEITGILHRPNSRGYWYRYNDGTKFHVSINSHGFSDKERKIEGDLPRIALIGDSTTEFWEMPEKYRAQFLIEKLLNNKDEVLNFGVRSYGTDQSFILFKKAGILFRPYIVIYTFCINDIFDNSKRMNKPYFVSSEKDRYGISLKGNPIQYDDTHMLKHRDDIILRQILAHPRVFIRDHSFIYRRTEQLVETHFWQLGRHIPIESHYELRPFKKEYNAEDSNRMEITLRIINALALFTEENGIQFLVVEGVYRPLLDDAHRARVVERYGDIFDFDRVTRTLENYCKSKDIAFLSLPGVARSRDIVASDILHVEDNMHFNKRGSIFYSEAVVRKMVSLGWVNR